MADDYEINLTNAEEPAADEQFIADEQSVADEQPVVPVRRRRRRQRRPKWQRLLWKYWPPIRFGLIILAGVLLLWLVISGIAGLFRGNDTPDTTPSTIQTEPSESTSPSTTAPPETTVPTEPIVTDPFADAVDASWFDDVLFIGDFTVGGMADSARSGNATYFATSGMGVFNYDSQVASDVNFSELDLDTLLTANTYGKIIVNIGINNCGYPTSSLISAYEELVDYLKVSQPNAKIILQGILPVTENYASGRDYFKAENVALVNAEIEAMADGVNVFYINVNENFTDDRGYLNTNISVDGCHMYASAYTDLAKWISVAVGRLGIE